MTKRERTALIRAYAKNLVEHMLTRVGEVPEHWDGRHLRNWFWMTAQESYEFDLGKKEMKSLKNDIIVRNL